MKLSILAVAILASTVSASSFAAAHAKSTLKISGNVKSTYTTAGETLTKAAAAIPATATTAAIPAVLRSINDRDANLSTGGDLNFDASAESNGLTYYGHAQIEVQDGSGIQADDIWVGVKGGFGNLSFGDNGNACDSIVPGGFPDQIDNIKQGGCTNASKNNIMYVNTIGAATVGISHNPNGALEHSALAVKGEFGAVTAGLGYVTGEAVGDDDQVVLGLTASFGAVTVGARASKTGDNNGAGFWGKYSSGANTFALGTGESEGGDEQTVAYFARDLGASAKFVTEIVAPKDLDTYANIRLQKNF